MTMALLLHRVTATRTLYLLLAFSLLALVLLDFRKVRVGVLEQPAVGSTTGLLVHGLSHPPKIVGRSGLQRGLSTSTAPLTRLSASITASPESSAGDASNQDLKSVRDYAKATLSLLEKKKYEEAAELVKQMVEVQAANADDVTKPATSLRLVRPIEETLRAMVRSGQRRHVELAQELFLWLLSNYTSRGGNSRMIEPLSTRHTKILLEAWWTQCRNVRGDGRYSRRNNRQQQEQRFDKAPAQQSLALYRQISTAVKRGAFREDALMNGENVGTILSILRFSGPGFGRQAQGLLLYYERIIRSEKNNSTYTSEKVKQQTGQIEVNTIHCLKNEGTLKDIRQATQVYVESQAIAGHDQLFQNLCYSIRNLATGVNSRNNMDLVEAGDLVYDLMMKTDEADPRNMTMRMQSFVYTLNMLNLHNKGDGRIVPPQSWSEKAAGMLRRIEARFGPKLAHENVYISPLSLYYIHMMASSPTPATVDRAVEALSKMEKAQDLGNPRCVVYVNNWRDVLNLAASASGSTILLALSIFQRIQEMYSDMDRYRRSLRTEDIDSLMMAWSKEGPAALDQMEFLYENIYSEYDVSPSVQSRKLLLRTFAKHYSRQEHQERVFKLIAYGDDDEDFDDMHDGAEGVSYRRRIPPDVMVQTLAEFDDDEILARAESIVISNSATLRPSCVETLAAAFERRGEKERAADLLLLVREREMII